MIFYTAIPIECSLMVNPYCWALSQHDRWAFTGMRKRAYRACSASRGHHGIAPACGAGLRWSRDKQGRQEDSLSTRCCSAQHLPQRCAFWSKAWQREIAFITDSSQQGPNGIIVVDLESDESWRQLNDHPSTKAENLEDFLPIVEGRPFLVKQQDGSVKQAANMGSDGIAISSSGERLYYHPLASRRLYSVSTQALTVKSVCSGCDGVVDRKNF